LSSNIIDFVRAGSKGSRQDINKILAELQDLNAEDPEDAALQERIALWDSRRKKISTIELAGSANQISNAGPRNRSNQEVTHEMPTTCKSFPWTVTNPDNPQLYKHHSADTKFAGQVSFPGGSRIVISHVANSETDLEHTNAFSIAFFMRATVAASSETRGLFTKSSDEPITNIGYKVYQDTDDTVAFALDDGTNEFKINSSTTMLGDVWRGVVCTYSGNSNRSGMKIYIGGSLETTGTASAITSTIKNTLSNVIGWNANQNSLAYTNQLSWLQFIPSEVNSTWVTNFETGHFDFSTGVILFAPFIGNDSTVSGEGTTPYCVSS